MVLSVSAASLKLVRTQIKLPPCIFDAGGIGSLAAAVISQCEYICTLFIVSEVNPLILNDLIQCNGAGCIEWRSCKAPAGAQVLFKVRVEPPFEEKFTVRSSIMLPVEAFSSVR